MGQHDSLRCCGLSVARFVFGSWFLGCAKKGLVMRGFETTQLLSCLHERRIPKDVPKLFGKWGVQGTRHARLVTELPAGSKKEILLNPKP